MAREGVAWADPDAGGWPRNLVTDQNWRDLVDDYGGAASSDARIAFERLTEVARANGCRSVLIENRYVDPDFRSDYFAFWARRFALTSPFSRRLHFFSAPLGDIDTLPQLPPDDCYLGYSVIRPIDDVRYPVGRTALGLAGKRAAALTCGAPEKVHLYGREFTVVAAPYLQEDREFLTCAHAAIWMCQAALANKRFTAVRHLTAKVVDETPSMLSAERAFPSSGISPRQVQAIFGQLEQPALRYAVEALPHIPGVPKPSGPLLRPRKARGFWDTRIQSIVCRYLNGGWPVFIGTKAHAFVLIGWWRTSKGDVRFLAHDPLHGPYREISPFSGKHAWETIMAPMPPKVYARGETVEASAYYALHAFANDDPEIAKKITGLDARKHLGLRVALRSSVEYKHQLQTRGLPDAYADKLAMARLARFVWVVEARLRNVKSGDPCVFAELVYDAGSFSDAPLAQAAMTPKQLLLAGVDGGAPDLVEGRGVSPWKSSLSENDPLDV